MPLDPGTRIGPYEIVSPLGAGGMGEVYKARDTRLDRMIAIKVLPSHLAGDQHFRQRFEREAKAISSLNHPNICTLHDIGHEAGIDYLVMELLDGETLATRLERGPLDPGDALPIATQIADALDKAHGQGLIHRDLKPANVMLTTSGAKLLDFGLAKTSSLDSPDASMTAAPTMTSPLTVEGTMVGTFQYMAPEQLEGSPATPCSDIFAFGAVLYEMLTAHRAFGGKTQASLVASILKEAPRPISAIKPGIPPGLERLVRTCLEKNPADRRQSMHDILLELKWLGEGHDDPKTHPGRSPAGSGGRQKLAWVVAAVAIIAAVAAVLGRFQPAPETPRLQVELAVPEGVQFEFRRGPMAVSPDGTRVVFVARDQDGMRYLYLRQLDRLPARRIEGTQDAQYPFWSPDGNTLGFFAGGKLKRIEASGGPVDVLCDSSSFGGGGAWSPEGFILFTGEGNTIARVSSRGGAPVAVTHLDASVSEFRHRAPSLLPDGEHFLYSARRGTGGGNELMLGSLSGDKPVSLLSVNSNAIYVSPGFILYWRDDALRAHPFDLKTLAFTGDPVPIAPGVRMEPSGGMALFSASTNGVLAYYRGGSATTKSQLIVRDREGKPVETVGVPGNYYSPALSRDGRRVAVDNSGIENNGDIWLYEIGRPGGMRLTFDPADESHPTFSPDGKRLIFWTAKEGSGDVHMMDVGGTGGASAVLSTELPEDPSDWSRDGRFISVDVETAGVPDVYVLSLEDKKMRPIAATPFYEQLGKFSPDVRWIAYSSDESGRFEVYVQSFPSGDIKRQISSAGGMGPVWRSDGKELFFEAPDGMMMAVEISIDKGFEASVPLPLFPANTRFGGGTDYDVFPDGQRFLINTPLEDESSTSMSLVIGWDRSED